MAQKDDIQKFAEDWFSECGQVVVKTFSDACDLVLAALVLGGEVHRETSMGLEKIRSAPGILPEDIARIDTKIAEAREGLLRIGNHIGMIQGLREELKRVMTFQEG